MVGGSRGGWFTLYAALIRFLMDSSSFNSAVVRWSATAKRSMALMREARKSFHATKSAFSCS